MQRKIDNQELGFSPIDGRPYTMGGKKPFDPKGGYNPVSDVLNDDLKDPVNTLPAKLIAIEDHFEDFCGKPTRFRAEVVGEFGQVQSRCVHSRRVPQARRNRHHRLFAPAAMPLTWLRVTAAAARTRRKSFKEEPDYVKCMAEIAAAVGK